MIAYLVYWNGWGEDREPAGVYLTRQDAEAQIERITKAIAQYFACHTGGPSSWDHLHIIEQPIGEDICVDNSVYYSKYLTLKEGV